MANFKKKEEEKNKPRNISMSDNDWEKIKSKADKKGVSVSQLIRDVFFK